PRAVVEPRLTIPEALGVVSVDVVTADVRLHEEVGDMPHHRPRRVEVLNRLDLNHLGAEVREDQRGEWPGPDDPLRDDADAGEGSFAVAHHGAPYTMPCARS